MKDCGADVAFNYKTTNTKEVLKEHGPINLWVWFIDFVGPDSSLIVILSYWDHVGGEILDYALEAAAPSSHFVVRKLHPRFVTVCNVRLVS